jgi:hypothetical protein
MQYKSFSIHVIIESFFLMFLKQEEVYSNAKNITINNTLYQARHTCQADREFSQGESPSHKKVMLILSSILVCGFNGRF